MILIIKHINIEGSGTLGDFFLRSDWKIKIVELQNGELLPRIDECEAIVSLGGPMNVYETDKYPFLVTEEDLLKEALNQQIPILGICFGAQLLAKSAGAVISKAAQAEIGWSKITLTEKGRQDKLFKDINNALDVFQWHEDTFDIPANGYLLATSTICRNQAFRIRDFAWGLQFHPEMTMEMIKSWLEYYPINADKEKIALDYLLKKEAYEWQAQMLYLNFAREIWKAKKTKEMTLARSRLR